MALIAVTKLSRWPVRVCGSTKDCPGRARNRNRVVCVIAGKCAEMATTNAAGRVCLRSPETGWQIERFLAFPRYAKAVAFSPDGQSLATAGLALAFACGTSRSPSRQPTQTIVLPIKRPKSIVFSPDGPYLAVTTEFDGTILLWDLATRRERMVLHHPSPVVCVAFSPDGRWLATGGKRDWSILLWDLQTGSCRILLEHVPGPAMALAFSPDGALLASASFPEHHARLWDLKTGQVRRTFEGHSRSLNSIAFSPDGSLLATAGNDGMVGLWSVATGQRQVNLHGQATRLLTVDFSPDGQTLVLATGDDDDLRLWDLASEDKAIASAHAAQLEMSKGLYRLNQGTCSVLNIDRFVFSVYQIPIEVERGPFREFPRMIGHSPLKRLVSWPDGAILSLLAALAVIALPTWKRVVPTLSHLQPVAQGSPRYSSPRPATWRVIRNRFPSPTLRDRAQDRPACSRQPAAPAIPCPVRRTDRSRGPGTRMPPHRPRQFLPLPHVREDSSQSTQSIGPTRSSPPRHVMRSA